MVNASPDPPTQNSRREVVEFIQAARSKGAYFYERLSETTYQLCAEFATDSNTYLLQNRSQDRNIDKWAHPQGWHCFNFEVTEQPPILY